jgi:hypothetical protein
VLHDFVCRLDCVYVNGRPVVARHLSGRDHRYGSLGGLDRSTIRGPWRQQDCSFTAGTREPVDPVLHTLRIERRESGDADAVAEFSGCLLNAGHDRHCPETCRVVRENSQQAPHPGGESTSDWVRPVAQGVEVQRSARLCRPDDVAKAAIFLASDDASCVNGATRCRRRCDRLPPQRTTRHQLTLTRRCNGRVSVSSARRPRVETT